MKIITHPQSKAYDAGWMRIFGRTREQVERDINELRQTLKKKGENVQSVETQDAPQRALTDAPHEPQDEQQAVTADKESEDK